MRLFRSFLRDKRPADALKKLWSFERCPTDEAGQPAGQWRAAVLLLCTALRFKIKIFAKPMLYLFNASKFSTAEAFLQPQHRLQGMPGQAAQASAGHLAT
jgi:hypothetical protein